MHPKNKDLVDYKCKFSTPYPARASDNTIVSNWRVFASQTTTGDIKISPLISEHNCLRAAIPVHSTCNDSFWLTQEVPQHLFVSTRKTTP